MADTNKTTLIAGAVTKAPQDTSNPTGTNETVAKTLEGAGVDTGNVTRTRITSIDDNGVILLDSGRYVPFDLVWTSENKPEVGAYYVYNETTRTATIEPADEDIEKSLASHDE